MKLFIPEPTPPKILKPSLLTNFDVQIDILLWANLARDTFKVSGKGLAVAVLDTGLRVSHECFTGRVIASRNFTDDDNGEPNIVTDYNGHGTNVAGLIAAGTNDERMGLAPAANIVPLKVLPAGSLEPMTSALIWVSENHAEYNITAVNMSLGVPGINLKEDLQARENYPNIHNVIRELNEKNIAVVIAAGNDYFKFQEEGMSIPAIFREAISVGAVYDSSVGKREYKSGAIASDTRADQITPFTQRLSKETSPDCYTDVFSAGASATSAGASSDTATSIQDGTSQAAPTVAGVILLLQEHHLRLTGKLPEVSLLQDVLRSTSKWLVDEDSVSVNVKNTGKNYPRINAYESLTALDRYIKLNS